MYFKILEWSYNFYLICNLVYFCFKAFNCVMSLLACCILVCSAMCTSHILCLLENNRQISVVCVKNIVTGSVKLHWELKWSQAESVCANQLCQTQLDEFPIFHQHIWHEHSYTDECGRQMVHSGTKLH